MPIQNIEPICAQWGRQMIDENNDTTIGEKETIITKALCVLAENGLYAMAVFLLSSHKKEYGQRVLTEYLAGLWHDFDLCPRETDKGSMLDAVKKITENLHELILARKTAEQALVFARYHAKAEVTASGGRP